MDPYSQFADLKPPGWRAVRARLETAARKHDLELAPGLADAIGSDPRLLCADGLHPNDDGHAAPAAGALPHLRSAFER